MDSKKLQYFKNLLQQQIDELSGDQLKTMVELTATDEHPADIADQASSEIDRNFELRIRDRERRLIEKMREAIQRIDDGTYGVCDECGEEISKKRLTARPVTTLCINCKTKQEQAENLRGRLGSYSGRNVFRGLIHNGQGDTD
ncbi:MAG: RNA polymerase-binding protein DksA [Syntrophales bacterium LBB04]|nr:RNA polymerase-binding protein DksA [Syntrophales bacterium LBB04]